MARRAISLCNISKCKLNQTALLFKVFHFCLEYLISENSPKLDKFWHDIAEIMDTIYWFTKYWNGRGRAEAGAATVLIAGGDQNVKGQAEQRCSRLEEHNFICEFCSATGRPVLMRLCDRLVGFNGPMRVLLVDGAGSVRINIATFVPIGIANMVIFGGTQWVTKSTIMLVGPVGTTGC